MAAARLACGLHRRQQQRDQNPNDGNHHQQLDEREAAGPLKADLEHGESSARGMTRNDRLTLVGLVPAHERQFLDIFFRDGHRSTPDVGDCAFAPCPFFLVGENGEHSHILRGPPAGLAFQTTT